MKRILTSLFIGITTFSSLQAQTAEELKAEREQLQTELKSKEAISREEKLAKLIEKTPKETGVQSVDGLAQNSTGILATVKSANDVLAKYKKEVTDNGDGEIDVTPYEANLEDYQELAISLLGANTLIKTGTEQLKNAQVDVKGLPILKSKQALSSIGYSTEALKLSGEEILLQIKLVNNLISTIKASKNL